MHANDMMKYGHSFIMDALDGVDESQVETGGVCGHWSVKDVMGHLSANEVTLVEVLEGVLGIDSPKPNMQAMGQLGQGPGTMQRPKSARIRLLLR